MRCAALLACRRPAAAHAGELFGGVYVHDVKLPTDLSGFEQAPTSCSAIAAAGSAQTPLQPYMFGALNTAGDTNYAAVGLSAKFGSAADGTFAPALALPSITARPANYYRTDKIAFGSRVLFEPEIGIGTQINDRLSIEGSWVHMSHAQLRGRENPGIDNLGVRVNLAL